MDDMGKMIEGIERLASENIEKGEADYVQDGLLYCGKCHTPKQTRVQLMGRWISPMCLCKCEGEKRDREMEKQKADNEFRRIMDMRTAGFADRQMQDWTFDNDDLHNEQLTKIAKNYADNFKQMKKENHGLLLYGDVGTGKTYIAACIANKLIDRGYPCLMTNFSRLVNEIQSSFDHKQEIIDRLSNYDLLVIDDFAAERNSEYMSEIVFSIIDERYRSKLPLIVTTNLTGEELNSPNDTRKKRLYSRLYEMCVPIPVEGRERRKDSLHSGYSRVMKVLKADRED